MSNQLRVTVTQWLRSKGHDPASAGFVVFMGSIKIPRETWSNVLVSESAQLTVRRE